MVLWLESFPGSVGIRDANAAELMESPNLGICPNVKQILKLGEEDGRRGNRMDAGPPIQILAAQAISNAIQPPKPPNWYQKRLAAVFGTFPWAFPAERNEG